MPKTDVTLECFTCWTTFPTPTASAEHRKTFHPFSPTHCVICGQLHHLEDQLLEHYKSHVLEDDACAECVSRAEIAEIDLGQGHVIQRMSADCKHHDLFCVLFRSFKKTRRCHFCGKPFKRRCDAKRHVAEVHLRLRHQCRTCQRHFSRRRSLTRHQDRYHPVTPHCYE